MLINLSGTAAVACEELYLLKRRRRDSAASIFRAKLAGRIASKGCKITRIRMRNVHVRVRRVLFVTLREKRKRKGEREKGEPRKPPVCTQCIEYFKKLAP